MAAKKINVKAILTEATHADMVSKNKAGNYLLRWGYFYRVQAGKMDAHKARVAEALGKAGLAFEFVGDGDHFTAFRGGAPIQRQSHLWLEVKVTQ